MTDYYSIPTEEVEPGSREGHEPEMIEFNLSVIEAEAAKEISAIGDGTFRFTPEGHYRIIRFVALQIGRVPAFRAEFADIATVAARDFVRSRVTRQRMREHLIGRGGTPTDAEVDRLYEDVRGSQFKLVPSEVHALQETLKISINTFMPLLWERTLEVVRFDKPSLLTSDSGVGLWAPDSPRPRSAGVANARAIFLPVNRYTALALTHRPRPSDAIRDPFWAGHINLAVADRASSWLYHHPEDDPLARLDLPAPRRIVSEKAGLEVMKNGTGVSKHLRYFT
jgi:hypothetical protein